MNRTIGYGAASLTVLALLVVTTRNANTQISGSLPAYIKLQATTPGTAQTGNSNITGAAMAGQFQGSGAGLTNLPWSSVVGAPTSFPPNGAAGGDLTGTYPNPTIASNVVDSLNLASDGNSLAKVTNSNMFVNGTFVGIGTTTAIGASRFVVNQNTNGFGGMYVNTGSTGLPFYGYAQGGSVSAYSYVDGGDANKWKLRVGTQELITATTLGQVGIGTATPNYRLEVNSGSLAAAKFVGGADSSNGMLSTSSTLFVTTNRGDGLYATTDNSGGWAVIGYGGTAADRAVYGRSDSATGNGVYGRNNSGGKAGFFDGNVTVAGTLSKGGGSFKIDHPLDPKNKYLYHSFVESPDMMNIYNGIVTTDAQGYATVVMPDWFKALNRDFRYSLTIIDSTDSDQFVQAKIVREMKDNRFVLRTSAPAVKVSWMVTGIRQDDFANENRIPVEEQKSPEEQGYYLFPKEARQPRQMGIEFHKELQRNSKTQPSASRP